ncbi:hypothetical protein RUND412_004871 [Rhizina undulata]
MASLQLEGTERSAAAGPPKMPIRRTELVSFGSISKRNCDSINDDDFVEEAQMFSPRLDGSRIKKQVVFRFQGDNSGLCSSAFHFSSPPTTEKEATVSRLGTLEALSFNFNGLQLNTNRFTAGVTTPVAMGHGRISVNLSQNPPSTPLHRRVLGNRAPPLLRRSSFAWDLATIGSGIDDHRENLRGKSTKKARRGSVMVDENGSPRRIKSILGGEVKLTIAEAVNVPKLNAVTM